MADGYNNPFMTYPWAFALANLKNEGAEMEYDHDPLRERRITEFEVELALDAAFVAGWHQGWLDHAEGLRNTQKVSTPSAEAQNLQERQRCRIDLAKAVAQAIGALAQIVDETGGVR